MTRAARDLAKRYSYRVAWSPEDGVFVARAAEWPLLSADGASPEAALAEIQEVVAHAIELQREDGKPIPETPKDTP